MGGKRYEVRGTLRAAQDERYVVGGGACVPTGESSAAHDLLPWCRPSCRHGLVYGAGRARRGCATSQVWQLGELVAIGMGCPRQAAQIIHQP